jgi:ureidoglycolate hydrolase
VSNDILEIFLELFAKSADNMRREIDDLEKHDLSVQYLVSLRQEQLHEYVM